MDVLITLTLAGADTGPFSLYSNVDGYTTPFQIGVSRAALVAGYTSTLAPTGTTEVMVKSTGTCNRELYLLVTGATTTTTTSTSSTSTTSTTSTTTTLVPPSPTTLTNNGSKSIAGAIRKNGVNITGFGLGSGGATTTLSLSGTTWGPTDKLQVVVQCTSPFGANLTVSSATILPNGGVAQAPTSYSGNGTNTVIIEFNGSGAGWLVDPMTWFTLTLNAS